MSNHMVHFYVPVTPTSMSELSGRLLNIANWTMKRENQNDPVENVTILLSSEGGNLNSGFTMYNFIRKYPFSITCINMGTVESIAIMIFLAADQRLAVENSRFLLHSFHWEFNAGNVDQNRIQEHTDSLAFDRDRYAAIFKERTQGCQSPVDILQCLNSAAKILNPDQAFNAGILTDATTGGNSPLISDKDVQWWVTNY